jgi:hypothetical protein
MYVFAALNPLLMLIRTQSTLQFTCKCQNGTSFAGASMAAYEQSVPALMCRFWYGQCVQATNQNLAQQFQCEQARNANCGNLTVNDAGAVSSLAPSGSATATASRSSGASSSPTGSTTPAASSGAAVPLAQYGAPILAGGLLAVFGIAL